MSDLTLIDELIGEMKEVVDAFYKESIKPIQDFKKEKERKIFDKAYKEVLELEK